MEDNGHALEWDATLRGAPAPSILLEEGDYNYEVTLLERGRHEGSNKIPACPKATLTLSVPTPEGVAAVIVVLYLYSTMEWKLSSFFRSIGLKKPGESYTMQWDQVVGRKGRAHFRPSEYTDKQGNSRKTNNVDKFLDFDPSFFADEKDFVCPDAFLPFT